MFYNHNGEIVNSIQLNLSNRSFLYGDGLFERMRLFNGKVFNRQNHQNRLSFSLKEMQLNLSISVDELINQVELLATKNQLSSCVARISIYRDSGGLYTPITHSASYIIESIEQDSTCFQLSQGMKLGVCNKYLKAKGILSTIKSSSANLYVLASLEKKSKGFDELLLLNSDEYPIEGTNSNLFIVSQGNIITPPLSEGPLSGSMRSLLISSFDVREEVLKISDVQNAEEIFFSNCNGIRYVKKFGNIEGYKYTTAKLIVGTLNTLI